MSAQKYLILGLGSSGQAVARFLLSRSHQVTAVDSKAKELGQKPHIVELCQQGLQVLSEQEPLDLGSFTSLIVSPGVPPTHPLYQQAMAAGLEIIGETELACGYLSQRMIGITGTNGKTTVTLLVTHVLNACGFKAHAVGNVGVPLISMVETAAPQDILVIELSSWQLETMCSKVLDAAVVLNVTPDHLDRHHNMENYARAKFAISRCLKADGIWMAHADISKEFSDILGEYQPHVSYEELNSASHDAENNLAAFALCRHFGVSSADFLHAAESFVKPPYRNQLVRTYRGVNYYNDSKGTNLDAVMKAVTSVQGNCILIAGGRDKGSSFTPWLPVFEGRVRHICAIGESANKIKEELSHRVPVTTFESLQQAVTYAAAMAKAGENVMLSPGCSSYDMFENYAHRGDEFNKCVFGLEDF
ncbi:MAG: Mur ligase family protein [Chlamydiales bacterium]|nr:Mur ligase family protein [Chlamydiales bacterium]